MAHHECDVGPIAKVSSFMFLATRTAGSGGGSLGHIQTSIIAMAATPQAIAIPTTLTVSSMKKAVVNAAASTGVQPGPGMRNRYCGSAPTGDVTIVSRAPVVVP